jgi:hypothetical protein
VDVALERRERLGRGLEGEEVGVAPQRRSTSSENSPILAPTSITVMPGPISTCGLK